MKMIFSGLLIASTAFADAVTDWNSIMLSAVRPQGAHLQSRIAAITHLAIYDAVTSITGGYKPYLSRVPAAPDASAEAAAVTAAHRVLTTYIPAGAPTFDSERSRSLSAIPDGPAKAAGMVVGDAAANAIIAQRANDGSTTPVAYTPLSGVGYWQPTPPAFGAAVATNWGNVVPFGIVRADQFRPGPPPPLTGAEYARDYNEIKEVGSADSATRPQDRTDLVHYMSLTSPTQIWNHLALQLSTAHRLTIRENARMFALMNMAVADAAIAVFEAKYFYNSWRPITAIRAGDLDANPRTDPDVGFSSLISAPAYPSYPSGYGALSNAARVVLENVFGKRPQPVSLASNPALPDMNLKYTRLRHVTDDIADARVFGGIHFRFEQEEAEVMGERVARHVVKQQLRRTCPAGCGDDH